MPTHHRVKETGEVYPHVETVDDMVKLQLDENTQGWYHASQLEACETPEAPPIGKRDGIEAP